ncbi:MAG: YihY/virulence factor BrkB family protein [Thermodesulfovibrionales bacterium]|jgi:membrane protein
MSTKSRRALQLLEDTFSAWKEDNALRLGAAVSFYTVLSLPPLLIIVIAVGGLAFGEEAVRQRLVSQFQSMLSGQGAGIVHTMIERADQPKKGFIASVIGMVVLLLGATGVFAELQEALNTIWKVRPKPDVGIKHILKIRAVSFALVLALGLLMLVSLVISTLLAAFGDYLASLISGTPLIQYLLHAIDIIISFGIITLLLALMFKTLPDAEITWKDVWLGAAVTAFLFTLGKFLIGLYLGKSKISSAYGAAGSLVIILLWIYYSSQIFFFGAEFTRVYANRYGLKIRPSKYAVPTTRNDRFIQKMELTHEVSSVDGKRQHQKKKRKN